MYFDFKFRGLLRKPQLYKICILNEILFRKNQNKQQISWENKTGFVKTCYELVIGSMEERFSFVEGTTSSYTSTTMKLELK